MSKKLLRYCFFSIIFVISSCAPKIAPPPVYQDRELSLGEVVTIAGEDITVLKAIVSIDTQNKEKPPSSVYASLLLKRPNWLHMRIYKYGMPVGDFLMKDDVIHTASGKGNTKIREYGKELFHAVFWWEDIENAKMHREAQSYVIRGDNREVRLDSSTLLPRSQVIRVNEKRVSVLYGKPKKEIILSSGGQAAVDFWYPSFLTIDIGTYAIEVEIEKLLINPPLNQGDFQQHSIN
jgi:hypothetical protein